MGIENTEWFQFCKDVAEKLGFDYHPVGGDKDIHFFINNIEGGSSNDSVVTFTSEKWVEALKYIRDNAPKT